MKQLISTINRSTQVLRLSQTGLLKNSSLAHFSTNNKKDTDQLDAQTKRFIEEENTLFDSLTEKEKTYYKAVKLNLIRNYAEKDKDTTLWWNKIAAMTNEEQSMLPYSYIKKFSAFYIKWQEGLVEDHMETNKLSDNYKQVQKLNELLTQEQQKAQTELQDKMRTAKLTPYDYELNGYLSRQPRVDLTKYNYNFEQFRQFTALYEESKQKDDQDLKNFYKMVRYTQENLSKGDNSAVAFAKKFRMDLITIPEEFKDLAFDDVNIKKDKRSRRPIIRTKTSIDLSNYDAWRAFDRELIKGGPKQACVRKIMLPPALVFKSFGHPIIQRSGFEVSGEYDFEDVNLDAFTIMDYKATQNYWGLNREDEYYDKFIHLPPHKRERKWPTSEEFWKSMELKQFKIYCAEYADWRKFKTWLKKTVYESEKKELSYDQEAFKKYDSEVDITLGDYEVSGKVNTEMAIFKWDYTHFMTKEDLKKVKEKPQLPIPPKSFDFSQAERVFITKEELKMREMLEQEKLKEL